MQQEKLISDVTLNELKRNLIKTIFSDINHSNIEIVEYTSNFNTRDLLAQLKDFRIEFKYSYPKFILYSELEDFELCIKYLFNGYTLSQVEEFYLSMNVLENRSSLKYR